MDTQANELNFARISKKMLSLQTLEQRDERLSLVLIELQKQADLPSIERSTLVLMLLSYCLNPLYEMN